LRFLAPAAPAWRLLEVRGKAPAGALPLGPRRSLLVVDGEPPALDGRVYDVTAALVAVEVRDERLMRRLTELDLERLPAVGSVARGVTAVIERRLDGAFRLFVPRELAEYVTGVVADLEEGLA
jgi:hypothetical protein